jgi:hypothetical protein
MPLLIQVPVALKNIKEYPVGPRHSLGFPPPESGHMGFVVDKVALRQVFSEYFGFPFQFSFH